MAFRWRKVYAIACLHFSSDRTWALREMSWPTSTTSACFDRSAAPRTRTKRRLPPVTIGISGTPLLDLIPLSPQTSCGEPSLGWERDAAWLVARGRSVALSLVDAAS